MIKVEFDLMGENVAYVINGFDLIGHPWKEANEDLKPCTKNKFQRDKDLNVKSEMIKNIRRKFRKYFETLE